MGLNGWLGAASGALSGVQDQMRYDDDQKRKDEMHRDAVAYQKLQLELRNQLETLKEGGRNDRTDKTLTTRRDVADADRTQRANAVIANTDLGYSRISSNEGIAGQRDDTTRRGQDIGAEQYWDAAGRDWSKSIMSDTTRRRGQDVNASTAVRGQDLVHGDRQDALDVASSGGRARNALGVLNLKARQKPNIFGTAGSATDWADEFDRLYSGGAGPDDLVDQGSDQPVIAAPAPAPASAASPAGTPGVRAPMRPRPQPQAAGAAPPKGLAVGATVTLRNGQKVVVKKVNPDGTFEY